LRLPYYPKQGIFERHFQIFTLLFLFIFLGYAHLRKELNIQTTYPRPKFNTSTPCKEHKKFPYLLRGLKIISPNQVWATDITYTAVDDNRAYVIAIIDLYSRKIMAYNVVNTMYAAHCAGTLKMALQHPSKPEIFNSDQGSQVTSVEFIEELERHKIAISMDGKGRCLDNAKKERFWWSLKYENIHLNNYESLAQSSRGIKIHVNFYNTQRHHSAIA
jgi:putative transposase